MVLISSFLGQRADTGVRLDHPASGERRDQPAFYLHRPVQPAHRDAVQRYHHDHGACVHEHAVHGGPMVGVMDALDDSLIEAAYDLGASKTAIWRTIIIPHCMPGMASGGIIVFMLVLGSYLTPNLMGGKTPCGLRSRSTTRSSCTSTGTRGGLRLPAASALIHDHLDRPEDHGTEPGEVVK